MSVPVVTKAQCATNVTNVEDRMICAGGVAGEDSCSVSSFKYNSKTLILQQTRRSILGSVCPMKYAQRDLSQKYEE